MAAISERIIEHINSLELEGKDLNAKLQKLLEKEYRRRLARYQHTNRVFTQKYGMTFQEFEKQEMVKKLGYSWEVESDSDEWEMALDGIKSMRRRLQELRSGS